MVLSSPALDPTTLRRAAAVVRLRGDVGDGPDLEPRGLQRPDRRLAARARALDEDVDLLHAVLGRLAGRVLGGHLRGERRRLARALEADVAGGGPADHRARGVGDRDDGVVERALDVRLALGDVLLLPAAHLLGACGAGAGPGWLRCFSPSLVRLGCGDRLLAGGLLLAGDGLLRALARAGVRLRPLAVDRKVPAVTQALVAADLDLATDVRLDLAAQVTLDPEVLLDERADGRGV